MKRLVAFTLALVLAFSSVTPVFAQDETGDGPISLEPNAPVVNNDVSGNKPEDDSPVPENLDEGPTPDDQEEPQIKSVSNQQELYEALDGDGGVYNITADLVLTTPFVSKAESKPASQIVFVGNDHKIQIDGANCGGTYMLGARETDDGIMFQATEFVLNGTVNGIAAIESGYSFNTCVFSAKDAIGTFVQTLDKSSASNDVEVVNAGEFSVFGTVSPDANLSMTKVTSLSTDGKFALIDSLQGTLYELVYTGQVSTGTSGLINLVANTVGSTASISRVTFVSPVTSDSARFKIAGEVDSGATFEDIVLPEFIGNTMNFLGFCDTIVPGSKGSVEIYILPESMRDACNIDTSLMNVTGLVQAASYSLQFPAMTVSTAYAKSIPLTADQAAAYWDPSRTNVTGVEPGDLSYELRSSESGGYEWVLTLNVDSIEGGSFQANSYTDGYYFYPNAYGMWEQVTTPCKIPFTINVYWTRGEIPVKDITVNYPSQDNTTSVAMSHNSFAWQASLVPSTATATITASIVSGNDVIKLEGNLITPLKPGSATISFTAGDVYKEVTFTVDSTPEYEWEQEVKAIQTPITLDSEVTLKALQEQLESLNRDLIDTDVVDLFNSYVQQLNELINNQPYKVVEAMIDSLPEEQYLALSHESQVNAAKSAYDALEAGQKELVSPERVAKLEALLTKLEELKKHQASVDSVIAAIEALPNPEDVKLEHEGVVNAAVTDLAQLDSAAGGTDAGVPAASREKLANCEKAIQDWYTAEDDANALHARVTALPPLSEVTLETKLDVDAIKADWNAANEKVAYFLKLKYSNDLTTLQKYYDRIAELQDEEYKKIAEDWNSRVVAVDLPTLTIASEPVVVGLQEEYNGFNDVTKKYVSQQALSHLEELKTKIAALKLEEDTRKAEEVINAIKKLPEKDKVTLEDETAISEARKSYDSLTDSQKKLVSNYKTLTDDEAEIEALKKAKTTADAFEKEVVNLPTKDNLTLESFKLVQSLYKKFLDFDQHVLRCLADSTKVKIVELYNETVKMANATIKSSTYDFTMKGLIGVNPKLDVKMPAVDKDTSTYTSVKSKLESDSGKELLMLYQMTLSGGVDGNPFTTVEVTFPVPTFYNDHTDVGLVEYDADSGKINYVKPEIVTINGQQYFKYNTDQADYVGVVAAKKAFAWVYSFFGRKIVSVSYADLASYDTTPGKVNPVMGDL